MIACGAFAELPSVFVTIAAPIYWISLGLYASRSIYHAIVLGRWNPGKDIVLVTTAICWYVGTIQFWLCVYRDECDHPRHSLDGFGLLVRLPRTTKSIGQTLAEDRDFPGNGLGLGLRRRVTMGLWTLA